MTLSHCGRQYATFDLAVKAASQKQYKTSQPWRATSCHLGDHWHVVLRNDQPRLDPFPPMIRSRVISRDLYCQRCGRSGVALELHHRRAKHMGGSKGRAHTQCCCNALSLCRTCHRWVHEHIAIAREHGWVVAQTEALPHRRGVSRCIGDNLGMPVLDPQWPTCDGRWVHSPLEAEQ